MTGDMIDLVNWAVEGLSGEDGFDILRASLWLLLNMQFVVAKCLPGRVWKVMKGSGMGLPHSGPLTN